MKKTLLTIIIPTFNSDKYIGETLECLVAQTNHDFTVQIIDDRSTDATEKIVNRYFKEHKFLYIKKTKRMRRGAASSINFAFSKVSTKYWALLDSDAFVEPNWVDTIIGLLDSSSSDDIIGAPIFATETGGLVAYLIGLEIESRYQKLKEGRLRHLSTCNIAGRKKVLEYISLNENLDYAYDHELSFQLKPHSIGFLLTKKTSCRHVNKNGFLRYFLQQYKIAKYHTLLSKKMPKQALKGDEISPSYLLLQPASLIIGLAFIPVNYFVSVGLLLFVLILNGKFINYTCGKSAPYIFPVTLLILLKNIAWICGAVVGTAKRNI